MKNKFETTIISNSDALSNNLPWWNRPVLGEGSLVDDIFSKFGKPEIPESAIFLHNREIMDLQVFAKTAETIDNEKFGNPEFLLLVRVKYLLAKGLEAYEGIYDSIKLLQVAIEAKESFISIDQTELRYRGSKQQELYGYVESLLLKQENQADKTVFRQQVQTKVAELLPQVKTEEGKLALESYTKHLEHLSEHELGLTLLSLFKTYQVGDYSILRTISEMINNLGKKDLQDFKGLVSLVMANYSVFEKLRQIISISDKQSNPDTYARMIQYIALSYRYQQSTVKFEELMVVLRKWYLPYQAIARIRQEYSPSDYQQIKDFSQQLPGLDIYLKYKNWLTDRKTGTSYLDFSEEVSSEF